MATASFFFLGGIAGCVLAAKVAGGGDESLNAYLSGFLAVAKAGELVAPSMLTLIWESMRWALLTVLLSFTALGLVGIPLLFCTRGFLLSFAIASFVRLPGGTGMLLALVVFGLSGCLAVPALFVLGAQGFSASRGFALRHLGQGRHSAPFGKNYFLRCGLCAAALCVCVLLEYLVVPALLAGMAGLLPA
ncbi:MAG: stage II sporulation protein M [Pseudoflavonifractor sp.]